MCHQLTISPGNTDTNIIITTQHCVGEVVRRRKVGWGNAGKLSIVGEVVRRRRVGWGKAGKITSFPGIWSNKIFIKNVNFYNFFQKNERKRQKNPSKSI